MNKLDATNVLNCMEYLLDLIFVSQALSKALGIEKQRVMWTNHNDYPQKADHLGWLATATAAVDSAGRVAQVILDKQSEALQDVVDFEIIESWIANRSIYSVHQRADFRKFVQLVGIVTARTEDLRFPETSVLWALVTEHDSFNPPLDTKEIIRLFPQ